MTPQYWHRLSDYPIETFDHLLTTNLRYAFVSAQHVARRLINDGRPGAIVNISSIASGGQPLLGAYGAAQSRLGFAHSHHGDGVGAPWHTGQRFGTRHDQYAAVRPRSR